LRFYCYYIFTFSFCRKMNLFEERIRKQIEKSKKEAAEKAAKEYERSLTVQYQLIHNVTVEMAIVTETQSVFVTEPKANKEKNISTEKTLVVTETLPPFPSLTTLSPSKDVYEKRVKDAVEKAKKEKSDYEYRAEQEYLYQNLNRSLLYPELSAKSPPTPSPPLATMPDKLYKGLSVQHTEGGLLVTANLSTYSGIAGLLGVMGIGNLLIIRLTCLLENDRN
jgi:hypothetical protein